MSYTFNSSEDISNFRKKAWADVSAEIKSDKNRISELSSKKIDFGGVSMKFEVTVKGKSDENGYPCYIALHGGGGSDKPDMNDRQWEHMKIYYLDSIENGVYVAPRGVRDTCDCHSNPESFPCYERLLPSLISHYNVDPNRVYMLGYSAGGDGTLLVTPVLADRFAAGNSSASYTAERNYTSLYNMPLQFQGGENDIAFGRNTLFAKCVSIIDNLKATYGGGYETRFFLHFGKGHSFVDRDPERSEQTVLSNPKEWLENGDRNTYKINTNAVDFLNKYTRNPYPERIIWDMTYRQSMQSVNSFYWLNAEKDVCDGIAAVNLDRQKNAVNVEKYESEKPLAILLNEQMLNLFSPIKITVNGKTEETTVKICDELIYETLRERGDQYYSFCSKILINKNGILSN